MKTFELRKFHSYPRLSHETTAFNAELWIDGKKAADLENSGKGGPNMMQFTDRKLESAFIAYCKSQPSEQSEYGPLTMDADLFISLLVEKAEHEQWLKKQTKKNVLFRLAGDKEGSYRCVKSSPQQHDQTVAAVRAKCSPIEVF